MAFDSAPMRATRQVVTVGVGQFGLQCSKEVWSLYCKEHEITPEGQIKDDIEMDNSAYTTFFQENAMNQFVPRCCLFDLEPTVLEDIQESNLKNLFDPERLISASEDAYNIYARGKFVGSKYIHPDMFLALRKTMEACDSLCFIHFINAAGGGTGTGYTCKISRTIKDELGFDKMMTFCLQASQTYHTSPVEYYNNTLFLSDAVLEDKSITYCISFDNESLYKFCPSQPTFWKCNQLISYSMSGITARMRFAGDLSCDFDDLTTNLIPYSSLNFLACCYSPVNFGKMRCDTTGITNRVFTQPALFGIDLHSTKYISCALLYRGACSPMKINDAVARAKKSLDFVDWMPTGFKVSISAEPVRYHDNSPWELPTRAVTMLANHGSVCTWTQNLVKKYALTKDVQAFFHHFIGAGMEEGQFVEAIEDCEALVKHYETALSGVSNE